MKKDEKDGKGKKEKGMKKKKEGTSVGLGFIGIKPVDLDAIREVSLVHLIPHELSCFWHCWIIQITISNQNNTY